ncbi:MAG: hypothetical protein WC087_02805 [Candidatus Paceibacterota bacterium]
MLEWHREDIGLFNVPAVVLLLPLIAIFVHIHMLFNWKHAHIGKMVLIGNGIPVSTN